MKKIFYLIMILIILLYSNAYAMDNNQLLDLRNKLFDESKDIKALLRNSKNVVLLNNMWDACIVTMTQLDAYFFMMGIFDAVSKDKWNEEAVTYLELWLTKIKNTDEINLKSLKSFPSDLEAGTLRHAQKMEGYFTDLNDMIDESLNTISKLKASVKPNR
ncbi:MAG: hypothetical protein NTX47_02160 [Candidatus Omnitrophica bacterium]|nr:hypothetical protein [Candidatus Omnitrophota bacterium]